MKTVKELKQARESEITCDGDQDDANKFIFDALIGITERLDAMEQPPNVREPAYTGPPYTGLTTGDEIVNSAKLRDAKAMEQPPNVAKAENDKCKNGHTYPSATAMKDPADFEKVGLEAVQAAMGAREAVNAAIERAARIEALRLLAQKHVANPLDCHGYEMAITHLEKGGDL